VAVQGRAKAYVRGARHYGGLGGAGEVWWLERGSSLLALGGCCYGRSEVMKEMWRHCRNGEDGGKGGSVARVGLGSVGERG